MRPEKKDTRQGSITVNVILCYALYKCKIRPEGRTSIGIGRSQTV